jgi:hypothetical protein
MRFTSLETLSSTTVVEDDVVVNIGYGSVHPPIERRGQ